MNKQLLIEQLHEVGGQLAEMEIALDMCEQSVIGMQEGVREAVELIESGRVYNALEILQIIAYGATEAELQEQE